MNVAWDPGSEATRILPFDSRADFTQDNVSDFQQLMYRPLYWFGQGASTLVWNSQSPADPPNFSVVAGATVVTIKMKPWMFTNDLGVHEPVDPASVQFWLNLDKAVGAAHYGGYVPNVGLPDQLKNVTHTPTTITLTFNMQLNPTWVNDSLLSEIVPLPAAWDIKVAGGAPGTGGCAAALWAAAAATCKPVWNVLSAQNVSVGTYATNPLWQWVDGPYRLHAFGVTSGSPDGKDVLFPNTGYSGPQKSNVGQVVYRPYTSLAAEVVDLQSNKLDIGYTSPTDVTAAPGPCLAGVNKLPNLGTFRVTSSCNWAFNAAFYNFGGSTSTSPQVGLAWSEINQTCIRQALQDGVDQPSIAQHAYNGYAVPSYSPMPPYPSTYNDGLLNSYPFNLAQGKKTLKGCGWNMNAFPATCEPLGGCGTGSYPIAQGSALSLTYEYPTGSPLLASQVAIQIADWQAEGIQVTSITAPPATVASDCFGGGAAWQICQPDATYNTPSYYGSPDAWFYAPNYFPSGELLYSASNPGGYTDPTLQWLLLATTEAPPIYAPNTVQLMFETSEAQYAADQLPFMYLPTPEPLGELSRALLGSLAPNPLGDFMPEYLYK